MEIGLRDYKYKELCIAMNEPVKTGKSKQLQIKNWGRFFKWVHPTKQVYRITEIVEIPPEKFDGRKRNGGARVGAGAPQKVQEEFDYIFKCFLYWLYTKNEYSYNHTNMEFYFTGSKACEYFGIYSPWFFDAYSDEKVNDKVLSRISDKLREKLRSWIINKIARKEGVTLSEGIIAYKDKVLNQYDFKDEYLESWKEYQAAYLKLNHFNNIKSVIDNNLWSDMIQYISAHYDGYEQVIKCHKIICDDFRHFGDFSMPEYEEYKERLNHKVVKELMIFFKTKSQKWDLLDSDEYNIEAYIDVIKRYVLIR